MINRDKIPEPTYIELVDLFGTEEAEKIIINTDYSFRAISNIIIEEKIVRYFGLSKFKNWIGNKLKLSLFGLLFALILLGFIIYVIWPAFKL
jgi:hypothetical protein